MQEKNLSVEGSYSVVVLINKIVLYGNRIPLQSVQFRVGIEARYFELIAFINSFVINAYPFWFGW